jgi:hypothetical protein
MRLPSGPQRGSPAVDRDGPEVALVGEGDPVPVRVNRRMAHEGIRVLGSDRCEAERQAKDDEGGETIKHWDGGQRLWKRFFARSGLLYFRCRTSDS